MGCVCQVNSISHLVSISDICAVMQRTLADANDNMEEMVAVRRHIHMNPELSFEEKETAAFIADRLRSYGLEFEAGVAGHGIVARIEGNTSGPCVALRADMDASAD